MKKITKKLLLCALSACLCCSIAGFAACSERENSSSPDTSQSDSTSLPSTSDSTSSPGASDSTSSGGSSSEEVDTSPLSFTLSAEEATVLIGSVAYPVTYTATQSGKPQTVTVAWDSDNKEVATVSADGKITGLKKGTATITAKTTFQEKEYTKTVAVTVNNDVELTILNASGDESDREIDLSMLEGDENPTSVKLGVSLYANGDTNEKPAVTWTPADTGIVTVENGLITAVGIGTTRVTVSYEGEPEATSTYVDVTVNPMRIDRSENEFMVFQKTSKANGRDKMTPEKLTASEIEGNPVSMRWDASIVPEGGTDNIPLTESLDKNNKLTGWYYTCDDIKEIPYGRQIAYILTDAHKEYKVTIYVTGTRIINVSGFKKWQQGGWDAADAEQAKHVVLDADIDFKGEDYSVAVNDYWAGMNPSKVAFNFGGTFDGRGHTISNASVRHGQSALICNTLQAGGVIKNVAFEHIDVVGNTNNMTALGGVVSGVAKNATIENVFVRGTLGDTNLSGLLAYYSLGTIKNCVAILENSPAINTDRPARGILGCSILPQAGAFENCVAIGSLPGVACWRERPASGGTRPHKFGTVEIDEDGVDVTQYMTNCYYAESAQTFSGLDLTKFSEYWDTTGTVPVIGDVDMEVSVPTTILMRESDGIRIQASEHVSLALKSAVTGVTLEGNLLTVDGTATQDATVTVVITSTLNEKFSTELTFTVDIMTHNRQTGDFAYFDKTAQNEVTIDLKGVLQDGETITAIKSLGGAEIITLDKIVDGVATFAYADWSKELDATGETELLVYTDQNVAYHLTVVVADRVINTVDEYKAWHQSRGEYVANKVVGGYIVLADDIDFENAIYSVSYVEHGGAGRFMFRFNGTFDGRGHSISNAVINKTQSGLIAGSLEAGGVIKNVALKGIVLTGDTFEDANLNAISGRAGYQGGIVDFLSGGVIENCYVEGEIKDDKAEIERTVDARGLICSRVTNGKVKNCVAVLTNTIVNVPNPTEEGAATPVNEYRAVLGNMLGVPGNSDAFTNCIAIGTLYGVCSQGDGKALGTATAFPNGFKDPNSDMSGAFENINSYETTAEYKESADAGAVNAAEFLTGGFWDFTGELPVLKANKVN